MTQLEFSFLLTFTTCNVIYGLYYYRPKSVIDLFIACLFNTVFYSSICLFTIFTHSSIYGEGLTSSSDWKLYVIFFIMLVSFVDTIRILTIIICHSLLNFIDGTMITIRERLAEKEREREIIQNEMKKEKEN